MLRRSLIARIGILALLMALLLSVHLSARKPWFDERARAALVVLSDDEPEKPSTGEPPLPDTSPSDTPSPMPVHDALPIIDVQSSTQVFLPLIARPHQVFLPLIARPIPPLPDDWLGRVNGYRLRADVPPVTEEAELNDNCWEHARYMAENDHITNNQDRSRPHASDKGQICAQKGNAWLGWGTAWQPRDAIDGWMGSVEHRLWLLYPTTPTFGFGFYQNSQRSAAGLDVLSRARFSDDAAYSGWPVRYPAPGQTDIPATRYPITLLWPYFDQKPSLTDTALHVLPEKTTLEHTATTELSVEHKGIAIIPNQNLPANATIEVTVTGTYKGQRFSFTWQFRTGGS